MLDFSRILFFNLFKVIAIFVKNQTNSKKKTIDRQIENIL